MEPSPYTGATLAKMKYSHLPPYVLFLAGYCQHSAGVSPLVVLEFLDKYLSKVQHRRVPVHIQVQVESALVSGKLGTAKDLITENERDAPIPLIEQETLLLLTQLHQYDLQKKPKSEVLCALCGAALRFADSFVPEDCCHMLHKDCAASQIRASFASDSPETNCATCKSPFTPTDIQSLDRTLYEEYLELTMKHFMASSGLHCPSCKQPRSAEDAQCTHCAAQVCAECALPPQMCSCAAKYARNCPNCEHWNLSAAKEVVCANCSNAYCLDCGNSVCSC